MWDTWDQSLQYHTHIDTLTEHVVCLTFDKLLRVLTPTVNAVSSTEATMCLHQEVRVQTSTSLQIVYILCLFVCVHKYF